MALTLFRVIREIEEFKVAMEEIQQKTMGKRVADMNTVKYCGRSDIFVERMTEQLTDEFLEAVKFYTELL